MIFYVILFLLNKGVDMKNKFKVGDKIIIKNDNAYDSERIWHGLIGTVKTVPIRGTSSLYTLKEYTGYFGGTWFVKLNQWSDITI